MQIYTYVHVYLSMSDIPYLRIHVVYVLRLCALQFSLHSIRDVYFFKNGAGGIQYFYCCMAIVSQCSNETA